MPPSTGKPVPRRPTSGSAAARPRSAPARAAAKLTAQAGPASGQEFPLNGDELVIGRSADNPVAIPDTSVSRKHALVRKTDSGWAVSDLGSGNGTTLNGEALADETPLNDGDVIVIGDTELVYSGPGGAPAAAAEAEAPSRRAPVRTARTGAERPSRGRPVRTGRASEDPAAAAARKRKLMLGLGGVMVLLLSLAVGFKAIQKKKAEKDAIQHQQDAEIEKERATLFQDAKLLIGQGKWVEGQARLQELQELDPEYQAPRVETYLKSAAAEVPNQKLLFDAHEAVSKGELATAFTALAKVKTSSRPLEEKLTQERAALDVKATEKMSEARLLMASQGDLAKMQQLKAICEDVLVARPDDREAPEFKKLAEAAIFRIQNPTAAPVAPDTPWTEVSQRFKNGDASGALSLAQACANKFAQCRQLEGQIKDFEAKSKRLEDLNENELIALFELDKKIAGGSSSDLSKPVRTQLVSKLFVKASQAKTTGNWTRAIELARKVVQADPNHAGAQSIISDARKQAHDVYLRGYQLKDNSPDEAIKLFKEVESMTPADDEDHQKAARWLGELQRQ